MSWNKISDRAGELPPVGIEVLGFSPAWVDEDYNPDGICVCHLIDDVWVIAKWCGYHDEWHTRQTDEDPDRYEGGVITAPTHWMYKPLKPQI